MGYDRKSNLFSGLYVLDVSWLYQDRVFSAMLDYVDGDRREKALSYRFVKDRALSLGAGLLLNYALAQQAAVPAWPPQIQVGEHGKPFLTEAEAIHFNISHSGAYVALAVDKKSVGVDIEKIGSGDEKVAHRCFTPKELVQVLAEGTVDRDIFCSLWALKESYLKFLGTGLTLDPLRLEISLTQPLRLFHDGLEKTCCLTLYESLPGYKLALCSHGGLSEGSFELVTEARLCDQLKALHRLGPTRSK